MTTVTAEQSPEPIVIEIACALPDRQRLLVMKVEAGCTAMEAVRRSGIAALFPEIVFDEVAVGVWGVALKSPETTVLRDGDRVEIYRSLQIDPKAARQARADARAIKRKH